MSEEVTGLADQGPVMTPAGKMPDGETYSVYLVGLALVCVIAYALASMDNSFLSLALPDILKDTGWSPNAITNVITGGFGAAVVAGLILGPLADRFGRKRMIQTSLMFTGVFSGLTAVVKSFFGFTVVRVLAGTALSEGPLGDTLLAEQSPPKYRGMLVGLAQAGNPLGNAIAGIVAAALLPHGWRLVFIVSFVPALFAVVAFHWVRESKRSHEETIHPTQSEYPQLVSGDWRDLVYGPYKRQFWHMSAFMFCVIFAYGILLIWGPTYMVYFGHFSPSHAAGVFSAAQWFALGSQILAGILSDYLRSKWLMFACIVCGVVSIILIPICHTSTAGLTLTIVAASSFIQGTYGVVPRYLAEIFPGKIRASAISMGFALSNLALVITPTIGGHLLSAGDVKTGGNLQTIFVIAWISAIAGAALIAIARNVHSKEALAA